MLIVGPDFERWIGLPGAGPCPRSIDIDRSRTGFSNLVSLRVYSFAGGVVINCEGEADGVSSRPFRQVKGLRLAEDASPEHFVHVRSDDEMTYSGRMVGQLGRIRAG